jgi:hypothetical protein
MHKKTAISAILPRNGGIAGVSGLDIFAPIWFNVAEKEFSTMEIVSRGKRFDAPAGGHPAVHH